MSWQLCLVAGLTSFAAIACARADPLVVQRGKDLFAGAVPLKARMVGHDSDLPPGAVRCRNCHQTVARPATSATPPGARPRDAFGPVLNRFSLTNPVRRRGGPPSTYDERAFCRVLRDALDPAHVMLPTTMPRYTLSDPDCHALWTYLVSQ